MQVTDPQGRSLHLHYLDTATARADTTRADTARADTIRADTSSNQRFRGVQSIDSPAGRYTYHYNDRGEATPAAVKAQLAQRRIAPVELLANLVQVDLLTRHEPGTLLHPWAGRAGQGSQAAASIDLAPDGQMRAAFWTPEPADAPVQRPVVRTTNAPVQRPVVQPAVQAAPEPAVQPSVQPSIQRDDFGRPVVEWRPGQGLWLRTYDAADHLIRQDRLDAKARPAGHIEQAFDAAGRLAKRRSFDASNRTVQTIERRYDERGHLAEERDGVQTTRYTYDRSGRLASTRIELMDEQGKAAYATTLQTAYGPDGQPDAKTLADGRTLRIDHDPATGAAKRIALQSALWTKLHDRLQHWLPEPVAKTVNAWLPQADIARDIGFHPYDGINRYVAGNGVATTKTFDLAGRVTAIEVKAATRGNRKNGNSGNNAANDLASSLQSERLSYRVGPRIREIEDEIKGASLVKTAFDYDGFGALKDNDRPRIVRTALSNDASAGSASASASTSPSPSPASTPTPTLERDPLGRTASDGTYRYGYTEAGQVETVATLDARPVARYRYNAHGQRVAKTVYAASAPVGGTASSKSESAAQTTTTTYYLWSEGKLVAEIEGQGEHQGQISTQYLYLGSQGRFAPIAKLEAAWTQGNRTGQPRTLYVHAGHRGEPTAMTDERARVVWRARPDAWGFVQASVQLEKTSARNPSSPADAAPDSTRAATMNLRLPGQYFDAETGLHDNVHRTYDPRPGSPNKGRYLTPDPLGYPDGDDPYAYVAGDPVNKIDPTGLYESDIHYYTTYFLAILAGMAEADVRTLALADQFVDNNEVTRPVDDDHGSFEFVQSIFHNQQQLKDYHFVLAGADGKTLAQYANASLDIADSPQLARLRKYAGPPDNACGTPNNQSLQFMGEYLHAFEDTYSHRDASNRPIDPIWHVFGQDWGIGHGLYGHEPDLTYDSAPCDGQGPCNGWHVREARTLAMEQATYGRITQYMQQMNYGHFAEHQGKVTPLSDPRVQQALKAFNSFEASEEHGNMGAKIAILNDALESLGYSAKLEWAKFKDGGKNKNGYDQQQARDNRQKNERDLEQADYPGTLIGVKP